MDWSLSFLLVVIALMGVCFLVYRARANRALKAAEARRAELYRDCFLRGLAGILAKIASADGSIAASEQNVVERLFADMGIPAAERQSCLEAYAAAAKSDLPISYYASIFVPYSNRSARTLAYEVLWDVVAADGKLDKGEDDALKNLVGWLELDTALYEENLHRRAGKFTEIDAALKGARAKIESILK